MESLGPIVRLQIQLDRLKPGEGPQRVFDPAPLREVPRLWITREGVLAPAAEGGMVVDVHHPAHPHSRNREGENALSLGFTAHYAAMARHFGRPLPLGIAGESLIVDTARCVAPEDLSGNLYIRSKASGALWPLSGVRAALPCAPFCTYLLGAQADPARLKEGLRFLDRGTRGYYATWTGEGAWVEPGDELLREP